MIGCDAGYFSSFLDDAAGRALWPDLDMVTAGWMTPAGRRERVGGGFVVDGRWSFASGCTHADVLVGACLVVDDDGRPEIGAGRSPGHPCRPGAGGPVRDRRHVVHHGLAGSGSNDYTCEQLFVPEEHTFALGDPVRRDRPLYRFPGAFTTKFHGVVLGIARRALDEVTEIAGGKVLMPQGVRMR